MTLWHQRLIIFFGKILAAIVVIVLVVFVVYYNFYFKKDNLIKYVPSRAVVYANFRLDQEFLNLPLIQKLKTQLPFAIKPEDLAILNPLVSNNASLAIVPEKLSSQVDYLLIFSLQETDGSLNSYLEALDQAHWQHLILTNRVLDRKVLVISNSSDLIAEVKEISRKEKPALADRVEVIFGLGKFKIGYWGKIYLDLKGCLTLFANDKDPKLALFQSLLAQHKVNVLYFGLEIKDFKFVLETTESIQNQAKQQLLMAMVPSNFSLSFSSANIKDGVNQGLAILAQNNPLLYQQIENNRDYVENLASFSFEQDVLSLFTSQAQIVLTNDQKFILAIKINEVTDLPAKLSKLEHIIKEYFAFKNPVLVSKKLPDNTYISEITKQPSKIIFADSQISGNKVRQVQANNEEFAYYIKDDVLILSNSSQKITDLLEQKDLINLELAQNALNMTNLSQNLVVKSGLLAQIAPILSNFSQLSIIENVPDENIRLILE